MWSERLMVILALALTMAVGGCGDDDGQGAGAADAAATPMPDAAEAAPDAEPSGAVDASVPSVDAEVTGVDDESTLIRCGEEDCARDAEICCFTGFPNITQACSAPDRCNNVIATCDGPEDCASGEICCGEVAGASCKAAGQCTAFPSSQLCHTDDDCADGKVCRPSMFVAWPICSAP